MTTINHEDGLTVDRPDGDIPDLDAAPGREVPASGPEDVLPARPTGHRAIPYAPSTPSPVGRVVLPLALAIVSVVAVFAAWGHLQSDRIAPAPTAAPAASGKPAVPVLSASPSSPVASSAAPSPSAPAVVEPSATPASTPTKAPTTAAAAIDRSVPVTVLNGTARTGLAAKVAAVLRSQGWTVVSLGNWRGGGVATTTVFVNGRADAAATMRRDLRAADTTRKPIGAMRTDRITVVVMDDYPRG